MSLSEANLVGCLIQAGEIFSNQIWASLFSDWKWIPTIPVCSTRPVIDNPGSSIKIVALSITQKKGSIYVFKKAKVRPIKSMISREALCGNSSAAATVAAYPARRTWRIGVIAAATKEFSLSAWDGDQVCKSEQGGECAQRGGTILSALSLMYIARCCGGCCSVSFFSSASPASTAGAANSANLQLTALTAPVAVVARHRAA